MKVIIKKKLKEISAMGGGAVVGYVDNRKKIEESSKITSSVNVDSSTGYESIITVIGKHAKIKQKLVIKASSEYIEGQTLKKLKECAPRDQWHKLNLSDGKHRGVVPTFEIDFAIKDITIWGEEHVHHNTMGYAENIFDNKMDAFRFFRQVIKEIEHFIRKNPDYIYSFFGLNTKEEDIFMGNLGGDEVPESKRTRLYRTAIQRVAKKMPGNWVYTPIDSGDPNNVIFYKCKNSDIRENYEKISDNLSLEEENLILELYHGMISEISQASGLTGHNIFPKASAEEEYEGYVERSRHQGLKNVYKRRKMRIRVQKTNKKA